MRRCLHYYYRCRRRRRCHCRCSPLHVFCLASLPHRPQRRYHHHRRHLRTRPACAPPPSSAAAHDCRPPLPWRRCSLLSIYPTVGRHKCKIDNMMHRLSERIRTPTHTHGAIAPYLCSGNVLPSRGCICCPTVKPSFVTPSTPPLLGPLPSSPMVACAAVGLQQSSSAGGRRRLRRVEVWQRVSRR